MQPLSDRTRSLLEQLHAGPGGTARERVSLLRQVADSHEPTAIISLIHLLLDRSKQVAASASDAIHRLLANATAETLLDLDEEVRRAAAWGQPEGWARLRPEDLPNFPRTPASRCAVLGLATFHPSGHVREQAVRLLAAGRDEAALPYLLIRLNDWVCDVRQAARQAVEQRLREGRVGPFADHLGLVLRLARCGREDHAGLVAEVVRRLTEPDHADAVAELVRGGDPQIARGFFRLAVERPGPHVPRLLRAALESRDGVQRLWAARHLGATETERPLAEVLAVLGNDPFMPVRREALAIRLQALPETAGPALEQALLDPSPSVRQFSRFHLSRWDERDFAAFYREALAGGGRRETALAGLGETGAKGDAARVVPFLTATDRRVRRAAVLAVGKLAGEDHVGALLDCLGDESPRVTREAQQALRGQAGLLEPSRLWATFAGDHRVHVRLAALALLDGTATWQRLPYLIRAAADPEPAIAARARSYIERRYNRVFTTPTAEERARIDQALEGCARLLDPGFLKSLRYRLGR
jgi:HEAT repeat protein